MKKSLFVKIFLLIFIAVGFCITNVLGKDNTVSNELFTILMPDKTEGIYTVEVDKNNIYIYDTVSLKSGFGGFAFGLEAHESPSEYDGLPYVRKLGELVSKNGKIYDIVLTRPTDVQFDYENKNNKTYNVLYELGESIEKNISGTKNNKFIIGQGMKGEELYKDVLKKYQTALKGTLNTEKLRSKDISIKFGANSQSKEDVLNKFGYKYFDINDDGIDELFIGEIIKGRNNNPVYDIYTMVNRKPTHVISANLNENYFACDKSFVCKEYFMRGGESGKIVYFLPANTTDLSPQVGFKISELDNPKKPWFVSYDSEFKKWENVDEKFYKERKAIFDEYEKMDFVPLSKDK